jgi:hypothetical protein
VAIKIIDFGCHGVSSTGEAHAMAIKEHMPARPVARVGKVQYCRQGSKAVWKTPGDNARFMKQGGYGN